MDGFGGKSTGNHCFYPIFFRQIYAYTWGKNNYFNLFGFGGEHIWGEY